MFNQFGDLERCALRPGNVHSADGWKDVLDPVVQRYRGKVTRIYCRADAAFAMPEVYEFLEAERIKYAIRLPANQVLQGRIGYLLKRPVALGPGGEPTRDPTAARRGALLPFGGYKGFGLARRDRGGGRRWHKSVYSSSYSAADRPVPLAAMKAAADDDIRGIHPRRAAKTCAVAIGMTADRACRRRVRYHCRRLMPSACHGRVRDSDCARYSARGLDPASRRLRSLARRSRRLREEGTRATRDANCQAMRAVRLTSSGANTQCHRPTRR